MRKDKFLSDLKELLEIDTDIFLENDSISLTSIETLSVMVFIDENFDKQVKIADLKDVRSPYGLMVLIGLENFID